MNILTKICVVVLLILVLVASVVFINMATVPHNYRAAYDQQKLRADLSTQAIRTQKLLTNAQATEIETLKLSRDNLAAQLAGVKTEQVSNPKDLLTAEMTSKITALNTDLLEVQLGLKAERERNVVLQGQLKAGWDEIAKMRETNTIAIADLTQARGELERSERVVQALERQLQDRSERIADLELQVKSPAAGAAAAISVPKGQVTGTITSVRGELASINVGAAQGVTRGQKLYIYRNASFVGYLRLDEVDEGSAAGTIVDKQLDPTVGDKVTNDLLK